MVDTDNNVSINLSSTYKLIHNINESAEIDIDEVWKKEKDTSSKYRLIFTIENVSSNVLFNPLTEIVNDIGSEDMRLLSDKTAFDEIGSAKSIAKLTRIQGIRNTEYTHPKIHNLTYLPGVDLFNNHIFRTKGFTAVLDGKRASDSGIIYKSSISSQGVTLTKDESSKTDPFNTIRDFEMTSITSDGKYKEKKEKLPLSGLCYAANSSSFSKHLYQMDGVKTFLDAIQDEVVEKDGWFGFYNKTIMASPINYNIDGEDVDLYINRVINDGAAAAGDFIDLFPDRSRFTFMPHHNKKLDRYEENWCFFLTYPYKNDETHKVVYDEDMKVNSLIATYIKEYPTDSGRKRMLFASKNCRHNLDEKSDVRFYIQRGGVVKVIDERVKGFGDLNGDYSEYFFSVDAENLEGLGLLSKTEIRFSKLIYGNPCKYYFRLFKRIPNFSNISDIEDHSIYEDEYSSPEYSFANEVNKLAFAKTAYGDEVVQVVYTDDIDIDGLKDNLGRPLTELYFTVVKKNKSNDKWYTLTGSTENAMDVEWSSCFSDVTCGLNIPASEYLAYDYNVRRIHNLSYKELEETFTESDGYDLSVLGYDFSGVSEWCIIGTDGDKSYLALDNDEINREISSDDKLFYGDLVEFAPMQLKETVLEQVFHRFNTLQRELISKDFSDIKYDEIYMDDVEGGVSYFDETTGEHMSTPREVKTSSFACAEEVLNCFQTSEEINSGRRDAYTDMVRKKYPGNILLEGYFYQPHYRLHIANFDSKLFQSSDTQVEVEDITIVSNELMVFTSPSPVYKNTEIVIQEDISPYNNIFYGNVASCVGNDESGYTVSVTTKGLQLGKKYIIFKKTKGIPDYAMRYQDTSGRYIWRNIKPLSEEQAESDLFELPFANGAHYLHSNIVFFLRRQDPDGDYGLNITAKRLLKLGKLNQNNLYKLTRSSQSRPELKQALEYVKSIDLC